MESSYYGIIVVTLIGFLLLAALLLVPVYRFLRREEITARSWTEEELEKSARRRDELEDKADPKTGES